MNTPSNFVLTRWFISRCMAGIYLTAFASIWSQMEGLFGSQGILPAAEFLNAVKQHLGSAGFWRLPTVFWVNSSDFFLHLIGAAGVLFSIFALLGLMEGWAFFVLWFLYLSILRIGQDFLSFQWDILLLEAGFLMIFVAPWKMRPGVHEVNLPSRIAFLLMRFLLFRLMFESGLVKLFSGDPAWRDGTAMIFHYFTQPLPSPLSWYVHQLPAFLQKISCGTMFFIECVVPWGIFFTRKIRMTACFLLIGLQLLIIATGNYCFFNLLAITLCFSLLDDSVLRKIPSPGFGRKLKEGKILPPESHLIQQAKKGLVLILTLIVFFMTAAGFFGRYFGMGNLPAPFLHVVRFVSSFELVNSYGLFAVMTTERNEIILEGSSDGISWIPYEFKWKPGDIKRMPAQVAPHQPRLDWQMWFAPFTSIHSNPWLIRLMQKLLEGSEPVLRLLAGNPFPDKPPKYIRASFYSYTFTNFKERGETGAWWKREHKGLYCPPVELREKRSGFRRENVAYLSRNSWKGRW